MTHVIKEFHWVRPNWFLSIWYVPCKSCTYLASRLALSPNRSNRASTWASSPKYHQVLPKWFLRLWCIRRKPCTYLAPKLTVSKQTKARFHMTHVIKEFHWVRPNWFLNIWYVPCKPCTCLASRLALFPNRPNRASTWASSTTSTKRCVKNGFLDYGALGVNRAHIFYQN